MFIDIIWHWSLRDVIITGRISCDFNKFWAYYKNGIYERLQTCTSCFISLWGKAYFIWANSCPFERLSLSNKHTLGITICKWLTDHLRCLSRSTTVSPSSTWHTCISIIFFSITAKCNHWISDWCHGFELYQPYTGESCYMEWRVTKIKPHDSFIHTHRSQFLSRLRVTWRNLKVMIPFDSSHFGVGRGFLWVVYLQKAESIVTVYQHIIVVLDWKQIRGFFLISRIKSTGCNRRPDETLVLFFFSKLTISRPAGLNNWKHPDHKTIIKTNICLSWFSKTEESQHRE